MLGLRLEDLLDADDVGVDLTQDLGNASQADFPVEATTAVNVVGGDLEQLVRATA
jgi:hypothetical protein